MDGDSSSQIDSSLSTPSTDTSSGIRMRQLLHRSTTARATASHAHRMAAETVTAKGMNPPSGDKHDYMSFGPYWWPDPTKPDGGQPHELARTRSLSYATLNATLFCELAVIGEKVGVDLWNYETADGRSIKRAVEWLMLYWKGDKPWTRQQITPVGKTIGRDACAFYQHFKHAPRLRAALRGVRFDR